MSHATVKFVIGIACGAAVFLDGCQRRPGTTSADSGPPSRPNAAAWFEDATERLGVEFIHDVGPVGKYFMPESVGSGLALLDYNNDGRLDLFFVQNAGAQSQSRNALFRQEPDGRFRNVSAGSGLDVTGRAMGVAVGDVNNDGWSDLAITEYSAIRLFLNQRDGRFREVTNEAGLDNPFWAVSACFFDYDRDGWLDLVVANYVSYDPSRLCFDDAGQPEFCGPKTFLPGNVSKLFHNRGAGSNEPRYEDVTAASGLGASVGPALGVVCADFDGDSWPDIFVANDGQPNRLWMNRRDGTFKDEAVARGVAFNMTGQPQGNMGIAIADFNCDTTFDIFVTHLIEETHALWIQSPRGLFQDRTALSRMATPLWHGTGFGTVAGDFDNDGAPDVAIVNGAVRRNKLNLPTEKTVADIGAFWAPYAERNQLFANDGEGRFRDISRENDAFCATARVGRGLVVGDLDNDGGLDLVVSNIASAAHIYRNVFPRREGWLSVRVIDPALGGRDAFGAEVTVAAAERRWRGWCNPGSSYASSNDSRVHFGLGKVGRTDAIEVVWPDGVTERFPWQAINQQIVLLKGDGMKLP